MNVGRRQAPVLETERLRLRAHRLGDYAACVALWTDPRVTQFISGKPSTPAQTWSRMLSYGGHWSLLGFGYWAVVEKTSGSYVGELGFADHTRDIDSMRDLPEAGWVLVPAMHGRGFATEALRAALRWADTTLEAARTVALISPENTASLRVAEKLGYRETAKSSYANKPTSFFERNAVKACPEQPKRVYRYRRAIG